MRKKNYHNRTKEELDTLLESVDRDFPRHYRKLEEITINVILKPEEVIEIAKQYHKKNNLDGVVNEDIHQLFFDEAYTFKIDKENRDNNDVRPAWRVLVDLPENPFLMEDYTLIVSDKDKKMMGMLDPNGHPVFEGNEFTDEDIEYVMNNEDSEG
ncbi:MULTISPECIES: hypothetical protein [unclassified Bacillus (in: firmicutes)]|uniref:hypothetical protein n=1 Tax=unclassified Bacillus (in: firmicutes) TaxID=185979 RepID=UPI0008DEEA32|nr:MULTISPECIES: hypothetical protein [unclassified Bacillus (in: firmicutes)]SFJ93229.1 hypothetical protein SAMN04488574_13542 [Bacillus sp. 71mf]SFS97820.1 hypothetical protein SAMN04488145_10668 [Bacillus sp. 103mf]